MSSKRHRQLSRKGLRQNPAVKAIRERKAALPWARARKHVQELVDAGALPPGCARVMEAMARCHEEHGQGVRDLWLLIGYGNRGDAQRVAGRARSRAEPPVHQGIAEEAGLSRRWAIHCVDLIVAATGLRKWWGGPHRDPRENHKQVLQRRPPARGQARGHAGDAERREHVHGIGGSGLANGYTVEGIPDPPYGGPPLPPEPAPEPAWAPPSQRARDWIRRITDDLAVDQVERQRERLRQREEQRTQEEEARGP